MKFIKVFYKQCFIYTPCAVICDFINNIRKVKLKKFSCFIPELI